MSVPTVYLGDVRKRPGFFNALGAHSPFKASSLGYRILDFPSPVFSTSYLFPARVGATTPFVLGTIADIPGIGSLFTVGFGYTIGILLAITVCAATSGGHFNPCVSVAHMVFNKFPVAKGIRYIIAQILGGYIACLLVYAQYHSMFHEVGLALKAAGKYDALWFTQTGPAGIIALYPPAGTPLGTVFVNEFVVDFVLGLVIWTILDPTNALVPPAAGPWLVSFAYGAAIWGFASAGLAANTGRDLGGRLAALTIWGKEASGGSYAALAALTNIPAMLFAVFIYELFLSDSDRAIPAAQLEFQRVHMLHKRTGGQHAPEGSSTTSDVYEDGSGSKNV
ncbi:putative aquaporin 2 [Flagelloscypha sp. PMI_526]|nr:putative aquaporin 2 [Flagelloscypha sp. PMI_526]